MLTRTTTIGSRSGCSGKVINTINNINMETSEMTTSNKIDESIVDSENLETSRFSCTLESQIQ
jgi:hypothetical protein